MRDVDIRLPDRRLCGTWITEAPTSADPWAPTLVFLHEGLGCVELWGGFPAALCARTGLRGFAYDRTGYGRSGPWPALPPPGYLAFEGDRILPRVLDAAGIGTCVLVGHGDGGTVALHYASRQPSMLRGVVTIGARVVSEGRTTATLRRARAEFRTGDLRERLAKYHGANVDAVFRLWNETGLSPGFEPMEALLRLPRVRVPVFAIQGEHDEYATVAQLRTIAGGVSGRCETVVVPGCGHGPHRQDEAATVALIARFVTTLGRGPGTVVSRTVVSLALALASVAGVAASSASGTQTRGCDAPEAAAAIAAAGRHVDQMAESAAADALSVVVSGCPAAEFAALALDGWREARGLAAVGGAPAALAPVEARLARLGEQARSRPPSSLDGQAAQYAEAVIRAAVAAAQDERDEMQVYLVHARGLATSLDAAGVARLWPFGIDEVEGELWLEVDRFDEARRAFERASARGGARGLVGLGHALRRLDRRPAACDAYRRALSVPVSGPVAADVRDVMSRLGCPER